MPMKYKKPKLIKNYISEVLYNLLLVLIPLIQTPFLSRVLGADRIGQYSYVQSICTYFILLATLGTSILAQREIATANGDKKKEIEVATNIFFLRFGLCFFWCIIYVLFSCFYSQYKYMLLIQSISFVACIFDVSWYFYGKEEFTRVVWRYAVFRILSFALIFMLVKTRSDIYKYIWINVLCDFFGNLFIGKNLYILFLKNINAINEIKKWLKCSLVLFIPQLAQRIYSVLDKTMIGVITQDAKENGFYEQTQKIINILNALLIETLSYVMLPRVSQKYSENKNDEIMEMILHSFKFLWTLGLPILFGMMAISDNFVPWFFGEEFAVVIVLMKIMAINIVPIGVYSILGNQYFIPTQQQNVHSKAITIGIICNFILNIILIAYMKSMGACIASVISNFIIAGYEVFKTRRIINVIMTVKTSVKSIFAGFFMYIFVRIASMFCPSSMIYTFALVLLGLIIYIIMLWILQDRELIYEIRKILFSRDHK